MININPIEVSFIIVFRNESKYISSCVQSILQQDYPLQKIELILVDSMSNDESREVAEKILMESNLEYRFFENPKKFLSSGWNIGIKQSKGNYVVRIDAHATIKQDFLSKAVKHIRENEEAAGVGGVLITESGDNKTIKHVLSSKFGVGNSKFRSSQFTGECETIVYGLYLKSVFSDVGFFNEGLRRTQDVDFHTRLRSKGYKLFQYKDIISYYYSRKTVKNISKQAYNNGKWTMINFLKKPRIMPIRYFVPFMFIVSLLLLIFLAVFETLFLYLLLLEFMMYISAALYFSHQKTRNLFEMINMLLLFLILHISYGIGSMVAVMLFPYYIRKVRLHEIS